MPTPAPAEPAEEPVPGPAEEPSAPPPAEPEDRPSAEPKPKPKPAAKPEDTSREKPPPLKGKSLAGQPISSADFKGRPLYVVFFADH